MKNPRYIIADIYPPNPLFQAPLLERIRGPMFHFHLAENGTTVKTEIIAGITTFLSMVYIYWPFIRA